MRIKVAFLGNSQWIPLNYNHFLQSYIYNSLDKDTAQEIHSNEYVKYFTFSLIQGKYEIEDKKIRFIGENSFYVSSIDKTLIYELFVNISMKKRVILERNSYDLISVTKIEIDTKEDYIDCTLLSPVTIHSTDENRKTIYYSPNSSEFLGLLYQNLSRKLGIDENQQIIQLDNIHNVKKFLTRYGGEGIIIEAYSFDFTLRGYSEYLKVIYDIGLGDRNSQGFGMIGIKKRRKEDR